VQALDSAHMITATTGRRCLSKTNRQMLVIGGDPFFNSRAEHLGALTVRHGVPAIYQFRAFAPGGRPG